MSFRVSLAFVMALAGFSAGCTRAPAEPAGEPSSSSHAASLGDPSADSATVPSAMSMHETLNAPPPAVTAASPTRCPKDPTPNAFLTNRTINVAGVAVEVEVASTDAESERGLMYRMNMGENHGMLFDLHTTKEQVFWMHNTCIPLDMLFIDENGPIIGILENVPVLNDEPRSVGSPSRYVLEVNAGWSRRHNVRAGDKIRLPN